MSGRGRALRTGVAWDMRTGFKEKGRKLRSDGERPGLWTRDADIRHPGRYVNVPPPDGLNYRPGPPATHAIGAKVDLSWCMQSDTHTVGEGQLDQPDRHQVGIVFGVLQRTPTPGIAIYCDPNALSVLFPVFSDGELVWGGFELLWGDATLEWGAP